MTDPNNNMTGKVCMVTGSTTGIGRATALELARRGATVILVGRNAQRGSDTMSAIKRDTGNDSVSFIQADLSSRAGVHKLAQEFQSGHRHLHVLVNNAGGMYALRQESIDGIELTLALNHLGPFLLTNLLLDALKSAAPSRVVNVVSSAHEDVDAFDFADPQATRTSGLGAYPRGEWASAFYSLALPWTHPAFLQYARSKLANILFTNELARRLAGSGVTANCVHPGLVASDFGMGNGIYGWFMRRYTRMRGISVEAGAAGSILLATSPMFERISGKYFVNQQPVMPSAAAQDVGAAARLWTLTEELTQLRRDTTSNQFAEK